MNPSIELSDVTVSLDGSRILSDVSITFPSNEVTCIVGAAGSGKSTLLKTAAGLIVPEHGRVCYKGRDIAHMNRGDILTFRKESAFAFQDAALWANQSIYNNLSLPIDVHENSLTKEEMDRLILEAVRRVGYSGGLGFRPSALSMGEQKLVSLARALVLKPELLFLDEPTASLDEDAVDRLIGILGALKAEKRTLIIVSHDGRLIAELADHLCVVSAGKLTGFGDAEHIAPIVSGELLKRIRAARSRQASIDCHRGDA